MNRLWTIHFGQIRYRLAWGLPSALVPAIAHSVWTPSDGPEVSADAVAAEAPCERRRTLPTNLGRRTLAGALQLLAQGLAALTLLVAIAGPAAAAGAEPASVRIMLVGSSTTQGSAGDFTWRYHLWKHLADNAVGVDFVGPNHRLYDNVRSSGGTVVESDAYANPAFDTDHYARWGRFLGTFSGYPTGAEDTIAGQVSSNQPDYVVVMLGLNDLTWFGTRAPAAVAADMQSFVTNARAARPSVRIVLVAVQPTKWAQDNPTHLARVAEYNQRLSDLAVSASTTASPLAYVPPPADFQPDFNQSPHDTYDGTHANARGEVRLADAVADVLSARYGLGPAFPLSLAGVATGPVVGFTLSCAPAPNMVVLDWTESPGATGYWFQRRVAGGTWDAQVYQLKYLTDRPLTNLYLTNGVTYEYRLQAAKWYDKGTFSNVCTATPSN